MTFLLIQKNTTYRNKEEHTVVKVLHIVPHEIDAMHAAMQLVVPAHDQKSWEEFK